MAKQLFVTNQKSCTDEEFISLFHTLGGIQTAKKLNISERCVFLRRRNLEKVFGPIDSPNVVTKQYPWRVPLTIVNGVVLIGSDFHIWPGDPSTCLRAFKKFTSDVRPDAIILNGDVMDFPRISRHPQGWESAPDPAQEIEAAQDHLADIVSAGKRGCHKIWTLGNHDHRLESIIANATPQLKGMKGIHLSDHFAVWQKAMSCMINEGLPGGATMVKHRYKSGQAAPRANTLNAGIHIVTGHLHSQKVIPVSDYRGDRYGVDTGCVADTDHQAFLYHEDSPVDWRSGFCLLTYHEGKLMQPELVSKWSSTQVQFRGKIIRV